MSLHDRLLFRDSTAVLELRDAVPRPASFDAAARTVEAVIASAAPVQRRDQRGDYLEILDPAGLDTAASRGASVLDSHQQSGLDNVLGTLDSVRVEGDAVIGLIRFSSRPEIAPVIADVRDGVIQHLSVGYEVAEWRDGTSAGQRTRTAVRWTIREASFVSVPADRTARTRALRPSGGPGDRSEVNRQIRSLGTRAGVAISVINDLIDRGASVGEAREEILFELQVRSTAPITGAHHRTTMDDPEARVRAMGEALYVRIEPRHQPSGPARQFIGLTIPELARECLSRQGGSVLGGGSVALIERALHTSSDFPLILADTVNRTLRASYDAATSAIRRLARETTAIDFRTKHRLMLDSSGLTLEQVNEHGEFKSGSMTEAEETYAIDSFGRIFGISRKALVNDDLGAFADISRRLGQAAAKFEADFLTGILVANAGLGPTMNDTNTLFHAAHGNVAATGAPPSDITLSAARLAMRRQTGPSGGLIVVEPKYVVVPPELETATQKQLTQIQAIIVDNVNVWNTKLTLVCEPRLTDPNRWYLTADPAEMEGLEFAFLAGAPGPQVVSRVGFELQGIEVRVSLDYGADFIEWRGWYSNAGV